MRVVDSLERIRTDWLTQVSRRLARGEGVRENFQMSLEKLYEAMQQAVETGDPAWLNPVLDAWVEARTETEVENRESSLPPILDQILQTTYEVAQQSLETETAFELIGSILPLYSHAFLYVSRKETAQHIQRVSEGLEKTKLSLERLDKSKSDFIAIAAHELKTPLTLIEGYTAMLRDRRFSVDDGDQKEILLDGIDKGTQRLREIVDDMIDVSLIDNNLLSLNFQPLWVNRLLDVIREEFREITQRRNLKMEFRDFPGSRQMTYGDNERLFQALRNVVLNAIKYTPDGGSIIVDGRMLPGFLEITVEDTGIGIDPEDHLRIFEKFGRLGNVSLHSSGKTKFKGGGPGLGLPITKGIIEAHGGALWVESEGYDEENFPGTTFHILLPLRQEPPDDRTAILFKSLNGMHTEQPGIGPG